MSLLNSTISWYLKTRMRRIEGYMERPHEAQMRWFQHLIRRGADTEWGKSHGFESAKDYAAFAERTPVQDYESLKPFIRRMMHGERNVLWPGRVTQYAKSSGTTSDKSKFIPISKEHYRTCLMRGCWDTLSIYHANHRKKTGLFKGKGIVMGGTWEHFAPYPDTRFGDVSAIMLDDMPAIGKYFYTPDMDTALMPDWEPKIQRMAEITSKENVTNLGGVPTWTIVLFRRILEITGKEHLLEVWPNLELYIHGGVSFTPYHEQFRQFFPEGKVSLLEIYNASEGYFSIQPDAQSDDMLLLLDNGIFYEFLPYGEWQKEHPKAIPLWEVREGEQYAIVISTNSGLWRYMPGDTVKFTSTSPYKIKVTGRVKHFINAFGEEVMVGDTDKALALTCTLMNATVREYTVAPIYFEGAAKGGHEWLVEFERPPADLEGFAELLDRQLQQINSDYEAKRYKNMAISQLKLHSLPVGTFHSWLRAKGKYGGQNKVPRLANHRRYLEEILETTL